MIEFGEFQSHSGLRLPWKLECDHLSEADIEGIAGIVRSQFRFGHVQGIPRGGLRLAEALLPHAAPGYPLLIVDDVLTTGRSMKAALAAAQEHTQGLGITNGVVIFARGPCPRWVWPIFTVSKWARSWRR